MVTKRQVNLHVCVCVCVWGGGGWDGCGCICANGFKARQNCEGVDG